MSSKTFPRIQPEYSAPTVPIAECPEYTPSADSIDYQKNGVFPVPPILRLRGVFTVKTQNNLQTSSIYYENTAPDSQYLVYWIMATFSQYSVSKQHSALQYLPNISSIIPAPAVSTPQKTKYCRCILCTYRVYSQCVALPIPKKK